MASTYSSRDRSASVSSRRSRKRPPFFRAHIQLSSAVRFLPTFRLPVGEGAKRVVTVKLFLPIVSRNPPSLLVHFALFRLVCVKIMSFLLVFCVFSFFI